MFEFDQWLGFLLIMVILIIGFWIMLFLMGILPYWIFGALKDRREQMKAEKEKEEEQQKID